MAIRAALAGAKKSRKWAPASGRARDDGLAAVRRELRTAPNIGKAVAEDLIRLGVRKLSDLRSRDPVKMYEQLARLDGVRHDPCVLDTFMAVVDFARTGRERPWWEFTAARQKLMAARGGRRTRSDKR